MSKKRDSIIGLWIQETGASPETDTGGTLSLSGSLMTAKKSSASDQSKNSSASQAVDPSVISTESMSMKSKFHQRKAEACSREFLKSLTAGSSQAQCLSLKATILSQQRKRHSTKSSPLTSSQKVLTRPEVGSTHLWSSPALSRTAHLLKI